jgi:predicted GNAT family acetyltransferase
VDTQAPHEDVITHEEDGHRGVFAYLRDGRRSARLTYSRANASRVIVDHTEVEPAVAGQGVGRRLLDAAVSWARGSHVKIIATCPFAAAQFAKDRGLRDVLA